MALKGKKPLASDPVSPSDSFQLAFAPCYKKPTKALKTRGAEVSSSAMSPQMPAVANITTGAAELSMDCCHTVGFQNKGAPTHAPHTTLSRPLLQRGGLQSLQWYHDSDRIPPYRYTGIQGLQIVYRRLQVGIQVRRSTESLQKVYRYHTCALKQETETQQTNSEAQKSKPRQCRAFCSSAFNVF